MMYDIEDLKSRALVESNILKQFILTANSQKRGEFKPQLDDLLIHEYQMANSVTLNVILSNYMVDLAYALDCLRNPLYTGVQDSYFKLVSGLNVNSMTFEYNTQLLLDVSDGNGTFKSRDLVLDLEKLWGKGEGVTKFLNLDSIWYGKKRVQSSEESQEKFQYDELVIAKGMNNFYKYANPFGGNPFDFNLFTLSEGQTEPTDMECTFNQWMARIGNRELNCIVENRFYKIRMKDEGDLDNSKFAKIITDCRYLLCVPSGFYGLQAQWNDEDGSFKGFILWNIGEMLPILSKDFDHMFCSFHVIGNSDETTLFLVVKEKSSSKKYHYLYLNESSLDGTYSFTEIDSVVVDQLVVPPSDVFSRVESIRELNTVNIAMTDYGFWDLETNQTDNTTYSYKNGKKYNPDVGEFNEDVSKLTTPTLNIDGCKFVEYCDDGEDYRIDRLWHPKTDWYYCNGILVDGEPKQYRDKIIVDGKELDFFGGTENFAVYSSGENDMVSILVNLTLTQFTNLIFSNPQLTNYFIEWLYEQVTHPVKDIPNGTTRGEWYLYNNYESFVDKLRDNLAPSSGIAYDNFHFQLNEDYGGGIKVPLSVKFGSIKNIIQAYPSSASTMTSICNTLDSIVKDTGLGIDWLVDSGEASLKAEMHNLFSEKIWPEEKLEMFVGDVVDNLVGSYRLLEYFRDYLGKHLTNDLKEFNSAADNKGDINIVNGNDVVKSVRDYIAGKVPTSLVIGGYRDQGPEDNSRYPNLDKYLYQNQRKIGRVQARDIMSLTNTLKEVMFGVQSTKFFAECDSYDELHQEMGQTDLFHMTQNAEFVALSKFVKSNNVDTLDINWNGIQNWLFGTSPSNCSDKNILRAFIRTQIYRPLFFKYDDYVNFSEYPSTIYNCTTKKYFIDHNGDEHQIVFQEGTWPSLPLVDKNGSQLLDVKDAYVIPEETIKYFNVSNKFEYSINYCPIDIVDDKFILNDTEFYVVRPNGGNNDPVNSIYFNEFQSNTEGQNQVAIVENNKFMLNGMQYVIEGSEISVDAATSEFLGTEKEWKCEIVDDKFQFDGTWYALEKDVQGEYVCVRYADDKDTKLIQIYVTSSGYAVYEPWNITFQFSDDWQQVNVAKKHQSEVIDRLETETCRFDGTEVQFDKDKTYDWYLANELLLIQRQNQSKQLALKNLGNGVIYTGALQLSTSQTKNTTCKIRFRNEVQNEDVVTVCELVKKYEDVDTVQQMGVVFDRDMKVDENRVFRGSFTDNSYQLVQKDGSGEYVFFVKVMDAGWNNINTAWSDISNWKYTVVSEDVGTTWTDESTQKIHVNWGISPYAGEMSVEFSPIYDLNESGLKEDTPSKYLVSVDKGATQYTVWINGKYVNFIVGGTRYRINLTTGVVECLVVQDMDVSTVDFFTQYQPEQLRNNLVQNIKMAMLNRIVENIVNSRETQYSPMDIQFGNLDLYLDMFGDSTSLGNYMLASKLDVDSDACKKFSQVYKNNILDIDTSNMSVGNVYDYLSEHITDAFGQKSYIFTADRPSIEVKRIDQVDTFTYTVWMDVRIFQDKTWLKNNYEYDKQYVLANAVVKDMVCNVKFTPRFDYGQGGMEYDVLYSVDISRPYDVRYNQIVYRYNDKTKYITIPERELKVSFSGINLKHSRSEVIDQITTEILSKYVESVFTYDDYSKMFVHINNCIYDTIPKRNEVIDNSVMDNPGMENGIWLLKTPWVIPPGDELLSYNRGQTYIRGQLYNVSNDDEKLEFPTGGVAYTIQSVPTTEYESYDIIQVLVETSANKWELRYVNGYDKNNNQLKVVSQESQAARFDFTNQTGEDGAYYWIERTFFDNQAEKTVNVLDDNTTTYGNVKFTRADMSSYLWQTPKTDKEYLKVATSENVVLTKKQVTDKFTLHSVGSGDDKQLFLTYNKDPRLPSRFDVEGVVDFNIDVSSIVNLKEYERSIRAVNSDEAHIKNYVYKYGEPGFYTISPWLTTTKINGKLVKTYDGYRDIELGRTLDNEHKFEYRFEIVDNPTSTTQEINFDFGSQKVERVDVLPELGMSGVLYICGENNYYWNENDGFEETEDTWDGNLGINGQVKIQFTNIYGDPNDETIENRPSARLVSARSGYVMQSIPDTRTSKFVVNIDEYAPIIPSDGQKLGVEVVDEVVTLGEGDEQYNKTYRILKVLSPMRVTPRKWALKLEKDYIASNGLYVNCGYSTIDTQYVTNVTDITGYKVGTLGYCFLSIPTNINDESDYDYYVKTFQEITEREAQGKGIDIEEYRKTKDITYIPRKKPNEYDWSYSAYFTLLNNSGSTTPELDGDGLDYPVTLDVLPAGKMSDEDGDVFNRVYEVQTRVLAEPMWMSFVPKEEEKEEEGNIWIDKASMVQSICAVPNQDDWKKLIYKSPDYSIEDTAIPPRMREQINKLRDKSLFLNDDYFTLALTQLKTFLTMIEDELSLSLVDSQSDISGICNFQYDISGIKFKNYIDGKSNWNAPGGLGVGGLFGYNQEDNYETCIENFNNHLLDEFKNDWRELEPKVSDNGYNSIQNRDYYHILDEGEGIEDNKGIKHYFNTAHGIALLRSTTLESLYGELNKPNGQSPTIDLIFGDMSDAVKYINAIKTTLSGDLVGMFVTDNTCNLFLETVVGQDKTNINWYTFDAHSTTMDNFVQRLVSSDGNGYSVQPVLKFTQYPISKEGWLFKMLNRDFTNTFRINDAFAIHCEREWGNPSDEQKLWYIPQLDVFVYGANSTRPDANTDGILDMAYEQYGDRLYVMFNGDNHIYAYDNITETRTFDGFVILKKETATLKLVTFNQMQITDDDLCCEKLFLDYLPCEDGSEYNDWQIHIYGTDYTTNKNNKESWYLRPGQNRDDFKQYNQIVFGDTLFDEGQLRFHNISKNKDMYDILDVNEVDGRYYGLFKNEDSSEASKDRLTYTVFKCEPNGGVVQRLPWEIVCPTMYKTNDGLYSLYVVSNEPRTSDEEYHPVLREISVPDSDEYPHRVLDISTLYETNDGDLDEDEDDLQIMELIMDEFKLKSLDGRFFALSNRGFHEIKYRQDFDQVSIDKMDGEDFDGNPSGFRDRLADTLWRIVVGKHLQEMHDKEQSGYFNVLKGKMNQFQSDFTVFDLIPTEFIETQDIGVIPKSPVDDLDDKDDHRDDSILTSTDILWTDGMFAQTDTNPGIVTCAVSNPATIYDDDTVFTKSQRNPSIEGTEFYDFINDQDGNVLMDLYAIPFIYRINSNNTYDLYINVPTTRTKYLNRLAGTLTDNGTTQVLPDDTRTRINFLDEPMANNLDESTTRLQVFMDKKYLSIGTVELVEISGNSIPTQIYRDVPNNGLYDSIALESRWNGEVVQIDEPSKDINKVMLEFECYGTDSQSIHIQGKTFINRALNEIEYGTSDNTTSDPVQRKVLTFDPNGGTVDETSRVVVVGELVGELPIPTMGENKFLGWFTDVGGDSPDGVQVHEDSFVTSDMNTLYAHWETVQGA